MGTIKKGHSAYERAGVWSHISFSWVGPLIHKGWNQLKLDSNDAASLIPHDTDAPQLSDQFEAVYAKLKVRSHCSQLVR